MTDKIVVLTTCETEEEAQTIARGLVEKRLAACAQVSPGIRSFYRWQGKIEDSSEVLLLIKTRRDLYGRLEAELKKMHSYDVPEILAMPVVEGAADYLGWMDRGLEAAG